MSKLPTLLVFRSRDGANNVDPFSEDVSGSDVGRTAEAIVAGMRSLAGPLCAELDGHGTVAGDA